MTLVTSLYTWCPAVHLCTAFPQTSELIKEPVYLSEQSSLILVLKIGLIIAVGDQAYHRCVLTQLPDFVGDESGHTVLCSGSIAGVSGPPWESPCQSVLMRLSALTTLVHFTVSMTVNSKVNSSVNSSVNSTVNSKVNSSVNRTVHCPVH